MVETVEETQTQFPDFDFENLTRVTSNDFEKWIYTPTNWMSKSSDLYDCGKYGVLLGSVIRAGAFFAFEEGELDIRWSESDILNEELNTGEYLLFSELDATSRKCRIVLSGQWVVRNYSVDHADMVNLLKNLYALSRDLG